MTALYGMHQRREHKSNDERFSDIDNARIRLEAMMGEGTPTQNNAIQERICYMSESMPSLQTPPPPLTAIGKERRIAETQLLSQLAESDDALSELWSLWFEERGPEAAAELRQAEELTAKGCRAWPKAEECLLKIIQEHGIHWAEPLNRLSILYYMQGRFEESRECCETVLSVKPWHFGALSGVVLVCASMGDIDSAKQWATRRLPILRPDDTINKRREEWCHLAVEDSIVTLANAEERVRAAFGSPDILPKRDLRPSITVDEDAWQ